MDLQIQHRMIYGPVGGEMGMPSLMPLRPEELLPPINSHLPESLLHERYRSSVSVSESSDCSDASSLNEPTTLSDIADIVQELNDDPVYNQYIDEFGGMEPLNMSPEFLPPNPEFVDPMNDHFHHYPNASAFKVEPSPAFPSPCQMHNIHHHSETSPPSPTESSSSYSTTMCTTSSSHPKPARRRNKSNKGTNKYTLPDFMCKTIRDKRFNPNVIKWLNEEEGIFLIVKPKIIAQMWGDAKGNSKMNYPSMSRGIRERRKYGYFDRVPQDPRYPKKLTYKFGPMVAQYLKR